MTHMVCASWASGRTIAPRRWHCGQHERHRVRAKLGEEREDGQQRVGLIQGVQSGKQMHLAPLAAFAVAHRDRAAAQVEVGNGELTHRESRHASKSADLNCLPLPLRHWHAIAAAGSQFRSTTALLWLKTLTQFLDAQAAEGQDGPLIVAVLATILLDQTTLI